MRLQQVDGEMELRALIARLENVDDESLYVSELLKGIVRFRYTGWEIYLFVEKIDSRIEEKKEFGMCCSFQGILCVEPSSYMTTYVIYYKKLTEDILVNIKEAVNWSTPCYFMHVPNELSSLLKRMRGRGTETHNVPCLTYVLHSTEKLLSIPDGNTIANSHEVIEIKQIPEDCVMIINSNWKFATEGSERCIAAELKSGQGYGVFVNGTLVSWILRRYYGEMGALHTLPGYRGRGYASHVVSTLSRHMLQLNMVPFVNIEQGNIASTRLFEKLGFKKLRNVDFITCLPGK